MPCRESKALVGYGAHVLASVAAHDPSPGAQEFEKYFARLLGATYDLAHGKAIGTAD